MLKGAAGWEHALDALVQIVTGLEQRGATVYQGQLCTSILALLRPRMSNTYT